MSVHIVIRLNKLDLNVFSFSHFSINLINLVSILKTVLYTVIKN